MSTPSPLVPQGSRLESSARSRSFPFAIALIAAIHVVGLGGLLFLGCGKDNSPNPAAMNREPAPPPVEAVAPQPLPETNTQPAVAPVEAAPQAPVVTTPSAANPTTGANAASSGSATTTSPLDATTSSDGSTGAAGEHKVKAGETGQSIATDHKLTVKQLTSANPGVDWRRLKVGQKIQIPAAAVSTASSSTGNGAISAETTSDGSVHVVAKGETLISIAKKHGVTWKAIRAANGLKSETLKEGQKLKIPAKVASNSSPAVSPGTKLAPTVEPVAIPVPNQPTTAGPSRNP